MISRTFLALFFFLSLTIADLSAQVNVSAELKYSKYMLYERVDCYVTVMNNSENPLELTNSPGHPWLSFIVTHPNGIPVAPEQEPNFPTLDLKPGESQTIRANITPLYSFRQPGEYRCEAVVDIPGLGTIISSKNPFNVIEGHKVWSDTRPVEGSQRTYSLLRFSPQLDRTALYLRVEDLSENTVFANLALGNVVSYVDPDVSFDAQGKLHVVQPIAMGTYLYSRVDVSGHIEHQGVFRTYREVPPHLATLPDGSVYVRGGLEVNPNGPTDRLSDTQLTASLTPIAPSSDNPEQKSSTSGKNVKSKGSVTLDSNDGPGSGHLPQ